MLPPRRGRYSLLTSILRDRCPAPPRQRHYLQLNLRNRIHSRRPRCQRTAGHRPRFLNCASLPCRRRPRWRRVRQSPSFLDQGHPRPLRPLVARRRVRHRSSDRSKGGCEIRGNGNRLQTKSRRFRLTLVTEAVAMWAAALTASEARNLLMSRPGISLPSDTCVNEG